MHNKNLNNFCVQKKRNGFFSHKKGIAPLIATVILVAFAVALGALVIDWNRGYVEDVADLSKEQSSTKLSCQFEIGLSVADVKGEQKICFRNESGIELTLENNEKTDIEDVKARVTTNSSIYGPLAINSTAGGNLTFIGGGDAEKGIISIDLFNGTTELIDEVLIFPGIDVEGTTIYCYDSAIIIEGPLNECD